LGRAKNLLYFENLLFHFVSLIKKISSLEPNLKNMVFEDKGQEFPKNFFIALSQSRPHGHRSSQIKKNGGFDFEIKKGTKNFVLIFFILVLYNLEIIMQKNKSEKIIFSAPKRAVTLIIAATLIIAPTVHCFDLPLKASTSMTALCTKVI
jgi:hypothetical protein